MNNRSSFLHSKAFLAAALSVAAAVTVIVAVIVSRRPTADDAYRIIKVFEMNGDASVSRESTGQLTPYVGMNLENGDALSTFKESSLRLSLDSDKFLLMEENTEIELSASGSEKDSKTYITLKSGAVLNEILKPLSDRSNYEIYTPKATMAVRGTSFRVYVYKDKYGSYITVIDVFHGSVEVSLIDKDGSSKGESVMVGEGKRVIIKTDPDENSGKDPSVDGYSYFVIDGKDGFSAVENGESPLMETDYYSIPYDTLYEVYSSDLSDDLKLNGDVFAKVKEALFGSADQSDEDTVINEKADYDEPSYGTENDAPDGSVSEKNDGSVTNVTPEGNGGADANDEKISDEEKNTHPDNNSDEDNAEKSDSDISSDDTVTGNSPSDTSGADSESGDASQGKDESADIKPDPQEHADAGSSDVSQEKDESADIKPDPQEHADAESGDASQKKDESENIKPDEQSFTGSSPLIIDDTFDPLQNSDLPSDFVYPGEETIPSNPSYPAENNVPLYPPNITPYIPDIPKPDEKSEYTVTFVIYEGNTKTQTVSAGGTVSRPDDPVRDGYIFDGWYLEGVKYDFGAAVTKNITLTAVWKGSDYTVRFLDDDNTVLKIYENISYGETVSAPEGISKTGHVLIGWTKDGVNKYDFSTPVTGDLDLTAMWDTGEFRVVFNFSKNDTEGNVVSGTVIRNVSYGGDVAMPVTGTDFPGYYFDGIADKIMIFSGWKDTLSGAAVTSVTNVTADMSLTAKYTESGAVGKLTLEANGKAVTNVSGAVAFNGECYAEVGTTLSLPSYAAESGYNFGWFKAESGLQYSPGTMCVNTDTVVSSVTVSSDPNENCYQGGSYVGMEFRYYNETQNVGDAASAVEYRTVLLYNGVPYIGHGTRPFVAVTGDPKIYSYLELEHGEIVDINMSGFTYRLKDGRDITYAELYSGKLYANVSFAYYKAT